MDDVSNVEVRRHLPLNPIRIKQPNTDAREWQGGGVIVRNVDAIEQFALLTVGRFSLTIVIEYYYYINSK